MTQWEEENPVETSKQAGTSSTAASNHRDREPLAQISVRQSIVEDIAAGNVPLRAIPESSTYEAAEPRDWIYPVPANKSETEIEDWETKKRDMIQDLSFCVDISNSTIIEDDQQEEPEDVHVDLTDVLGGLDESQED